MAEHRWTWTNEQDLPSKALTEYPIVQRLLKQMRRQRWTRRQIFAVHLAAEEALVNAIKHGNRYDPHKTVRVSCKVSPECVQIQITDQGEGFDPQTVPDPTREENLGVPHGRGILLMRNFVDVQYNDTGNQVVLETRRRCSPAPRLDPTQATN